MKIAKTNDAEEIERKIHENDGYCPCRIVKTEDTKCMCKDFREQIKRGETGTCHCGLYRIYQEESESGTNQD